MVSINIETITPNKRNISMKIMMLLVVVVVMVVAVEVRSQRVNPVLSNTFQEKSDILKALGQRVKELESQKCFIQCECSNSECENPPPPQSSTTCSIRHGFNANANCACTGRSFSSPHSIPSYFLRKIISILFSF